MRLRDRRALLDGPQSPFLLLALALLPALAALAPARAATGAPKVLPPARVIKAVEGYFDEVFALDAEARRLAVVRTDGATFAKLELVDLGTGVIASSVGLPAPIPGLERLEILPGAQGVLVVAEEKPGRFTASLVDAAGRVAATVGPASAFGCPPQSGKLVALDRRSGPGGAGAGAGATSYTLTAFDLPSLAPAGKPAVYRTAGDGEVVSPPLRGFRMLGFVDGYARALGERGTAPSRMAVLDTLTGKVTDGEEIEDALGWAVAATLRAGRPGRSWFAALNEERAGVDIVNPMGKRQPAALAISFALYDAKSLRDQEGPPRGAFTFSLTTDPLNADAIKRRKPDMPMLDLYAVDVVRGKTRHRGRVFAPRPVTWRAGHDRLVVLKRLKQPTRGGDELQVFELR